MSEQVKDTKAKKAEAYWDLLNKNDIDKLRRETNIKIIILILVLGTITIFSIFAVILMAIKPTPVIAFDKQGKSILFTDTAQQGTTEPRIRYFLGMFINNYEGVSPRIDEDLAEAYNMLIPKFREILLLKGAHKEKIETWKGKNIETVFSIDKLQIKGDMIMGSKIGIIGTGKFLFRPVIISGNNSSETFERYVYFKAQIMVMPITEQTIHGLLIEFYQGKSFETKDDMKAYLLENNIPLIDDDNGVVQ